MTWKEAIVFFSANQKLKDYAAANNMNTNETFWKILRIIQISGTIIGFFIGWTSAKIF